MGIIDSNLALQFRKNTFFIWIWKRNPGLNCSCSCIIICIWINTLAFFPLVLKNKNFSYSI